MLVGRGKKVNCYGCLQFKLTYFKPLGTGHMENLPRSERPRVATPGQDP
jgi:hypothetical protein